MGVRPSEQGFTLPEVLLVLGLIASFFALTFVNLGQPQTTASLNGSVDTILADLRGQQSLSMSGDSAGSSTQQPHGLKFSDHDYTLYAGDSFNGGDANNYTTTFDQDVSLTTSFTDNQVLFKKTSGEVQDYSDGNNTITITSHDETKTITINRFGVATVN